MFVLVSLRHSLWLHSLCLSGINNQIIRMDTGCNLCSWVCRYNAFSRRTLRVHTTSPRHRTSLISNEPDLHIQRQNNIHPARHPHTAAYCPYFYTLHANKAAVLLLYTIYDINGTIIIYNLSFTGFLPLAQRSESKALVVNAGGHCKGTLCAYSKT